MATKKMIVVVGATGAQGGGLARAFRGAHGAFCTVQGFREWLARNKTRIPLD